MLVPNIFTLGAAVLALSSTSAAPLAGSGAGVQQQQDVIAARYHRRATPQVHGSPRQAYFAVTPPSKNRRAAMSKRAAGPSSLDAVMHYAKRFVGVDERSVDEREDDGSQPHHYYQPIGRRSDLNLPADKRANSQCGVKAVSTTTKKTTTTSAKTTTKSTTTAAKTTTKSTTTTAKTTTTTKSSTTTSKAASTPTSATRIGKGGAGLVTGYWPSWSASTLPPESIAWSKYDIVFYAFGVPTTTGAITIDDSSLLKRFVSAAHAGNTKAVLSIGGWGQSNGFSNSVSSSTMRAKFASSVLNVISTYNLDGIDFDWEYPGNVQGGPSNPSDTKNFQQFLTDLRPQTSKLLSAAVPQQVWQAADGNPVSSVARASAALDHIVIMNYDVWGSSSTPGPNAPLGNLCGNSTQPVASAAGGVKAWTAAGFARSKILLGVPAYGYLNQSTKKKLIQRDLAENDVPGTMPRMSWSEHMLQRRGTLTSMDGTTTSGQINFNQIVAQGALTIDSSTGKYVGAGGFTKYWDDCSDTPFLSNGNIVVTYDDPDSLYDKADFATLASIAGVAMWSIDGDTSKQDLTNALIAGLKAN